MPDPLQELRRSDPVMRRLVDERGPLDEEQRRRGRPLEPYGALVRSIVGQQLSTKAARTIYERLTDLFDGRTPSPAELLAADPEEVRSAGLSRPKVAYLRSLAEHVESGELELARLSELPDEEVIEQLTAVKGLGQWTADMFLIFHLEPPRRPAGRRPGHQARGRARVRPAGAARCRAAHRDRRAVAAAPLTGVALPLALARQRAGLAGYLVEAQAAASSSSFTRKDEPQPQEATTFGF